MPKTIIVIRHGKTQRDKSNPNRSLTKKGISDTIIAAKKLKRYISSETEILSSDAKRAVNTANIIARELGIKRTRTFKNLRVENIGQLENNSKQELTFRYFELFDNNALPDDIPTPPEVAKRFLKAIKNSDSKEAIFVGHSGALESFINYQNIYITKKMTKELIYSEFVILRKRK